MLKIRLIPVLLLKKGHLVRSESFEIHQILGNPINEVKRFNEWNVDELIYLDISDEDSYDMRRDDHKVQNMSDPLQILDEVSKTCFMPLTWGGRIRSYEDAHARISRGADKITINSEAYKQPKLIGSIAKTFGNQAVVASVDAKLVGDGKYDVFIERGKTSIGLSPVQWAKQLETMGAGEILLQSIDRDGIGEGYDLELIHQVSSAVRIPVIACSGVGNYEDYVKGVKAGAAAVAAANIFHFKELSDRGGKRALAKAGINVRI